MRRIHYSIGEQDKARRLPVRISRRLPVYDLLSPTPTRSCNPSLPAESERTHQLGSGHNLHPSRCATSKLAIPNRAPAEMRGARTGGARIEASNRRNVNNIQPLPARRNSPHPRKTSHSSEACALTYGPPACYTNLRGEIF
jgi:hypothetical protein